MDCQVTVFSVTLRPNKTHTKLHHPASFVFLHRIASPLKANSHVSSVHIVADARKPGSHRFSLQSWHSCLPLPVEAVGNRLSRSLSIGPAISTLPDPTLYLITLQRAAAVLSCFTSSVRSKKQTHQLKD